MKLKPGGLPAYRKYHDEIWPELVAELERNGIGKIAIFEEDPVLFLYSEVYDEDSWDRLWASEVHVRWAVFMDELIEMGQGGAPDVVELREVFHLQTGA
jgi:L-rhamnose mutarotase